MASEHIVLLTRILEIKPHPNADNLEIAIVEGWQVLTQIGMRKVGELVVFVPIDSLVPEVWAKQWGVFEYLAGRLHNRVKCVKLRGEPSFGFIVPVPEDMWDVKEGSDVKEHFGITKHEPPVRGFGGGPQGYRAPQHPLMVKYTDIQNIRNYASTFEEGEAVIVTEKIHGANFRAGYVDSVVPRKDFWSKVLRFFKVENRTEQTEEYIAGSHNVQRKISADDVVPYTYPVLDPNMRQMLECVKLIYNAKQVIAYGEVYGAGVQELHYGIPSGYEYMVFDILVDGKWLNFGRVLEICDHKGVPVVPLLYRGPFDIEKIKALAEGNSTVPGADHVIEGVVVQPEEEAVVPNGRRKILKCLGVGYILWRDSKKGSDFTEE